MTTQVEKKSNLLASTAFSLVVQSEVQKDLLAIVLQKAPQILKKLYYGGSLKLRQVDFVVAGVYYSTVYVIIYNDDTVYEQNIEAVKHIQRGFSFIFIDKVFVALHVGLGKSSYLAPNTKLNVFGNNIKFFIKENGENFRIAFFTTSKIGGSDDTVVSVGSKNVSICIPTEVFYKNLNDIISELKKEVMFTGLVKNLEILAVSYTHSQLKHLETELLALNKALLTGTNVIGAVFEACNSSHFVTYAKTSCFLLAFSQASKPSILPSVKLTKSLSDTGILFAQQISHSQLLIGMTDGWSDEKNTPTLKQMLELIANMREGVIGYVLDKEGNVIFMFKFKPYLYTILRAIRECISLGLFGKTKKTTATIKSNLKKKLTDLQALLSNQANGFDSAQDIGKLQTIAASFVSFFLENLNKIMAHFTTIKINETMFRDEYMKHLITSLKSEEVLTEEKKITLEDLIIQAQSLSKSKNAILVLPATLSKLSTDMIINLDNLKGTSIPAKHVVTIFVKGNGSLSPVLYLWFGRFHRTEPLCVLDMEYSGQDLSSDMIVCSNEKDVAKIAHITCGVQEQKAKHTTKKSSSYIELQENAIKIINTMSSVSSSSSSSSSSSTSSTSFVSS